MSNSASIPILSQHEFIAARIRELKSRLSIVTTERIPIQNAYGRVLGQDIVAPRDSPALDVSAMDGYAIRIAELDGSVLPICGTSTAGSKPLELALNSAVRVFTGAPVPATATCVVRREDCNESETYVSVGIPKESLNEGLNIRRRGENAKAGDLVAPIGTLMTPNRYAGAVTFSNEVSCQVYRKVRVAIINTGDELMEPGQAMEAWQIRDSNGPFLESMLARHDWAVVNRQRVVDNLDSILATVRAALPECDVMLLTGGVSMGDTDYVPDAIRGAGCQVAFHRIPIRPGKPILGAVGPAGQLVLGLPGNPISVAVTFRRIALELIRHVAGLIHSDVAPTLRLDCTDMKTLDLTWFRLVTQNERGSLSLVATQGSGDIVSLVASDGFVEIPPHSLSSGSWPYYAW
jgi:molybdopterin molybdotransferase